ncbi:hypothetical protein LCGC14_0812680 [marine sediment metagenome]|uniref:Uncharacterized protein n=1 Tax=marine sediment metagenome TaxID=412755 RepID=A0A0F9PQQ3_9ZZZZ
MATATPPIDLNQHVGHEPILQSLNLPVKPHLPTTVKCPLCHVEKLQIYATGEESGRWYTCQHCGFRGDAIEFYQAAHGLDDIHDAIYELANNGALLLEKRTLSPSTISQYLTTYVEHRKKYAQLFKQAQEQLMIPDRLTLRLLHEHHLWEGFRGGRWHKELGRFLGMLKAYDLREAGIKAPPGFYRSLVCPFYDVPGRISSLLLIGRKGRTCRISTLPPFMARDDGLMMSDWLNTDQPYVLALADPSFALRLQRKSFNALGKPSGIVVYGAGTSRAWQMIKANRVIFWEGDEHYTTLRQAMMRVNSYVAKRPNVSPTASSKYLDRDDLATIIQRFKGSARSWPEAMKEFILTSDHWQIADYVRNLEIPVALVKRIYDVCSPSEKQLVRQILDEVAPERFAYVGSNRIAEVDDCWYILYRDHRELACSAVIRLEQSVNVKETGENRYEGVITSEGRSIRFNERVEVVEKRTAEWLRDTMMAGGMPPPIIDPKIQRQLMTIAKKFHRPEYVQKYSHIGWNQELQSFIFPNLSIKDGQLDDSMQAVISKMVLAPASSITARGTAEGHWDVLIKDDIAWATLWAGLAGFMSNLLAPIFGAAPQPFGFIGLPGSVGAIISDHLRKELDMLTAVVERSKEPLRQVRDLTKQHGYPVWFDPSAKNRRGLAYIKSDEPVSVMTLLTEGEAAALAVGAAWTFIRSQTYVSQIERLPRLCGVFEYLAWMQQHEFKLEAPATSLAQCVLASLKDWAFDKLGASDERVFTRASQLLHTPDMEPLDRRLLHLIFWLRKAQRVKVRQLSFYEGLKKNELPAEPRSPHLLIDEEAKKVYMGMMALRTAVFMARLPIPDFDNALQAFAATSNTGFEPCAAGFVIDQEYHDSEWTRWLKRR